MSKPLLLTGHPNQPNVAVRPAVIEKLGEPACNHDALEDLFYGTLELPYSQPVTVDLYSGWTQRNGWHNPLVKGVVHINVPAAHKQGELAATLLHEGQHIADRIRRPAWFMGWTAARTSLTAAPAGIALFDRTAALLAVGAALLATQQYDWYVNPLEKSAHRTAENPEYLERYATAISFST